MIIILLGHRNQTIDVVGPININQAELLKVNVAGLIMIKRMIHRLVVIVPHNDAAELQSLDKFLKFKLSVVINIEATERLPIILEFLLKALVNNA